MNDIGIIFRAEFLRKMRSRPFVIGSLVGALAIFGLSALPNFVSRAFDNATRHIVLAGDPALVRPATTLLQHDYDIVALLPAPDRPPTLATLNAYGRAAAFVLIERRAKHLIVTAYTRDPGSFDTVFARDLIPLNFALAGDRPLVDVTPLLDVETHVTSLDAKFADQASADAARGVAFILVLLLYMSIMLNSQTVMASVAEEKTSRIAEILVSTTSPARLLTAKILAAGAAGLIQLALWIAVGAATGAGIIGAFGGHALPRAGTLGAGGVTISTTVIVAFIAFFAIGFMQYATLYAAAASLINRTEDLGSVAAPLMLPVIGGFFLAQYALAFPRSAHVAVLSLLPLVSPFVMFTRMTLTAVPGWQIALSFGVNAAATVAILWGAGKVYRVGLLLYGRPPSLRQVVAALRA